MTKHIWRIALAALLAVTAGCGGGAETDAVSALDAVQARTSPSRAGSSTGVCGTYTALEIEQRLGIPVQEGHVAAPGGTACQWDATSDESAYVQIQSIADTSYWEKPEMAQGYQTVPGIGHEAFVVPELGGLKAGARTDAAVVYVSMVGGSTNQDSVLGLLRDYLGRTA